MYQEDDNILSFDEYIGENDIESKSNTSDSGSGTKYIMRELIVAFTTNQYG